MTLKLYYHPLASYCHKVLIALYETGAPFEKINIDLGNPEERAALAKLWPPAKFPVLQDTARDTVVPESSIIIEYLAQHYPGNSKLVFADPDLARQTRLRDRYFDLYLHNPMQAVVADRLRPADKKDPYGVAAARDQIEFTLSSIDKFMAEKTWAMGDDFTMADCAASPALFYCNILAPFGDKHKVCAAYLERLVSRPTIARVLEEAGPYLHMMPQE